MLSGDVLGRYEQETWWLPRWVSLGVASFLLVVVVLDVVIGRLDRAVVPALGVAFLLVTALVRHKATPLVSTEVTSDGVVVVSTGRRRDVVRWEQVAGVRVFQRYSRPQVVLTDGSPVQLLAVPDEVARSLAAQLPAVLGRPVWFEVDDRRTDPAPPPPATSAP